MWGVGRMPPGGLEGATGLPLHEPQSHHQPRRGLNGAINSYRASNMNEDKDSGTGAAEP